MKLKHFFITYLIFKDYLQHNLHHWVQARMLQSQMIETWFAMVIDMKGWDSPMLKTFVFEWHFFNEKLDEETV